MQQSVQNTMGDKEMVTDLLSTQKHITSVYNTYAGECQCTQLRDAFLDILKDEHMIQSELFTEMNSRGWYPTKEAPVGDINMAKQKFTNA